MEKLPIFSFSQWVIANGGTVRVKDGMFEPVDQVPHYFREYQKGEFSSIELSQKDGTTRIAEWDSIERRFKYYYKPSVYADEPDQRDIPQEILSLLHSTPEPFNLTKICVMLGINRKEGRRAIKQLVGEFKVLKGPYGYVLGIESLTI